MKSLADSSCASPERGLRSRHGALPVKRTPTVAEYRRQAAVRERWRSAIALLFVSAVAALVFSLVPLPPAATTPSGSTVAASSRSGT